MPCKLGNEDFTELLLIGGGGVFDVDSRRRLPRGNEDDEDDAPREEAATSIVDEMEPAEFFGDDVSEAVNDRDGEAFVTFEDNDDEAAIDSA